MLEAVTKRTDGIEPQSLGILADVGLECNSAIEHALEPIVARFLQALPSSLGAFAEGAFPTFLKALKVDNFGTAGTRRVFEEMRVNSPPPSFRERAVAAIRQGAAGDEKLGRAVETALAGAALVHRRVFSYAEFDVNAPGRSGRTPSSSSVRMVIEMQLRVIVQGCACRQKPCTTYFVFFGFPCLAYPALNEHKMK